jgi:hypothetical protein
MGQRFFAARYFGARFFAAVGAAAGGYYFGSRYFAAYYFDAGYYGPVTLSGDATAPGQTLTVTASLVAGAGSGAGADAGGSGTLWPSRRSGRNGEAYGELITVYAELIPGKATGRKRQKPEPDYSDELILLLMAA